MTKKLDAGNSKKPSSASITRRKRTTWTTVDNNIINDTTLNLKALGLLTYMLSKPDAWVFSQAQIGATWGEGKESMQSAMRRLTECGYVQRETVRDEKGRIRTITVVSEDPIPLSERVINRCRVSRLPVEPAPVNPADGKPGTLAKTDLKKRLIEKESPVGFASFYAVYPKKQAKTSALKAYNAAKISSDELAAILIDVETRSQCDDWTKEDGKYIPMPATYLNQRRWEDGETAHTAGKVNGILAGAI